MEKIFAMIFLALSAIILTSYAELQKAPEVENLLQTTSIISDNFSEALKQEESTVKQIIITAGDKNFSAFLYDNETAYAFADMLPMTLNMNDLNGNEKYFYLSDSLPASAECPDKINAGDIALYGSSCIVLFYETFSTSYSYTKIGYIDDPTSLVSALDKGEIEVKFEKIH